MKTNLKTMISNLKDKTLKVEKTTKTEFFLENGDVFPFLFELDEELKVDEFQEILNGSQKTLVSHLEQILKKEQE